MVATNGDGKGAVIARKSSDREKWCIKIKLAQHEAPWRLVYFYIYSKTDAKSAPDDTGYQHDWASTVHMHKQGDTVVIHATLYCAAQS